MPRIDVPRIANFSENRDQRFHQRLSHNRKASSESPFLQSATELYSYAIPLPASGGGDDAKASPPRNGSRLLTPSSKTRLSTSSLPLMRLGVDARHQRRSVD